MSILTIIVLVAIAYVAYRIAKAILKNVMLAIVAGVIFGACYLIGIHWHIINAVNSGLSLIRGLI